MKFIIRFVIAVLFIMTPADTVFAQDGSVRNSYIKGIEAGLAGELDNAEAAFNETVSIDPGFSPAVRWLKALGDVKGGRVKGAALEYSLKGEMLWEKGRLAMAKEEYARAVKADPGFIEPHMALGQIFYNEGSYGKAVQSFKRALALEPDYAAAYVARGSALTATGDMEGALADLGNALRIDPENAAAFVARGSLHTEAGRTEDAISDFNSAIEIYPMSPSAFSMRGYLYMVKLRDKDRGCADWKKACELGACDNLRSAVMAGLCG